MRLPLSIAAAVTAAGLLTAPALAAPVGGGHVFITQAQPAGEALLEQVQYHRRGYGDRGRYRGRDHDRGGDGGAVAAGVIGGLLLGAVIANQAQQNRSVDYCVRRFRSYDPRSGTYLGNDGYRHRCP